MTNQSNIDADVAALRVPFRDVDMHGHVHNAVYMSYCEAAINDFLRSVSLSDRLAPNEHGVMYLVRKAELLFTKPSMFEDLLRFEVAIARIGKASLTFSVDVFGDDGPEPRVTASIVWVCVDVARKRSVEIPHDLVPVLSFYMTDATAVDRGR